MALVKLIYVILVAYVIVVHSENTDSSSNNVVRVPENKSNENELLPSASQSASSDTRSNNATEERVIPNLSSLLPNPNQITQQIQSTLQMLLQKINTTISSSPIFSALAGPFRNISKPINLGNLRLEDLDFFVANISEIVRSANVSDTGSLQGLQKEYQSLQNAFARIKMSEESNHEVPSASDLQRRRDVIGNGFERGIGSLQRANSSRHVNLKNGKVGMRKMWDQLSTFQEQVDSNVQKSISEARESLEDSLAEARQGASSVLVNQTMGIVNGIRRMFDAVTEPFRRFLNDMRGRLPTNVVKA